MDESTTGLIHRLNSTEHFHKVNENLEKALEDAAPYLVESWMDNAGVDPIFLGGCF
jgi:hypothetical protein